MRFYQLFILHFNKNIGEISFQVVTAVTSRWRRYSSSKSWKGLNSLHGITSHRSEI